MLKSILDHELKKFERRYDYDTSYMRELAEFDVGGAVKLGLVAPFTRHQFSLPAAPYFAAKITAVREADCGSCLRLAITMAEEAGVPHDAILSMLTQRSNTPKDMAIASRYARAVLDDDPGLIDIIGRCEELWGRPGIAGLAAAVVSGVFYPVLKRGLGHGNACEPVLRWLETQAGQRQIMEPADG